MFGKKLSEEAKNKIRRSKKGKTSFRLGKTLSEKHKENMRKPHGPMSDETKEKIRIASIGRQFSKETRNKISKAKVLSNEIILKIKQLRLSGVSISKTAQQLGISISSVKRYQY